MVYRNPEAAPESAIPPDRRGPVVGRICRSCYESYPLHRATHSGKPLHGNDHVASPCALQGDAFLPGEDWWEPAVLVMPPPVEEAEAAAGA
jgi:hypothetical protein